MIFNYQKMDTEGVKLPPPILEMFTAIVIKKVLKQIIDATAKALAIIVSVYYISCF